MKKLIFIYIFLFFIGFINSEKLQKFSYIESLNLYFESMHSKNYEEALLYARRAFVGASNINDRANILLYTADIYVQAGNYKKAKILYRQIINNYYKHIDIINEAKKKLLKL